MGIQNGIGFRSVRVVQNDTPKTYKKVKQVASADEPHLSVKATDDDATSIDVLVVGYDYPKDYMPVNFLGDAPAPLPDEPTLDTGIYLSGGTLDNWNEARNKSTLSVFEDGVECLLDSTSPCGPSLKLEGLSAGSDYNFKFRFEQDTGSGYSLLRFDASSGLYSGNFGDVSDPDVQNIDITLTATSSTMYMGALRINHPAGAFIKISEISITQV